MLATLRGKAVKLLRRIWSALILPFLLAFFSNILLGIALWLPPLADHPVLESLKNLASCLSLLFFLPFLGLILLDRKALYRFLFILPTLLSPGVWFALFTQNIGDTLNSRRFGPNLPTPRTYRPQGAYRLPFQGFWLVANGGPDPETSHSWGILGQRYAYDFVIKDSQGKTYRTHGRRPEDYYAFGAPLLAPADGVVVRVQNRHRDCPWPGFLDPFAWSIIGNYVLIRHGEREYSLLAHLKRGSVRVKPGQWVRAGEVVGECGNSGHSTEPHLHFQFLDRPHAFLGLSLPIPFTGFLRRKEDGSLEATPLGFPIRGEEVAPSEQGLGQ